MHAHAPNGMGAVFLYEYNIENGILADAYASYIGINIFFLL
jgi:hypothetical protein